VNKTQARNKNTRKETREKGMNRRERDRGLRKEREREGSEKGGIVGKEGRSRRNRATEGKKERGNKIKDVESKTNPLINFS